MIVYSTFDNRANFRETFSVSFKTKPVLFTNYAWIGGIGGGYATDITTTGFVTGSNTRTTYCQWYIALGT